MCVGARCTNDAPVPWQVVTQPMALPSKAIAALSNFGFGGKLVSCHASQQAEGMHAWPSPLPACSQAPMSTR